MPRGRSAASRPQPAARTDPGTVDAEAADAAGAATRWRWRMRAPVAVAGARLARQPGRAVLVVLGVAVAITMLVGVLGGSVAAQDRTLQRALAELPASQRSYRIDSFGLPAGEPFASVDRQARASLALLTSRPPLVVTSFSTLNVGGESVRLAGIDGLDRLARLVSGRWPRVCDPARCEVVQVGSHGGRPVLSEAGINLVRVGVVTLPDRTVFGGSLTTTSSTAQAAHLELLLTSGAGSFEHLPALGYFYRTYSWIAPIDPRQVQIWQLGGILRRESDVQAQLGAASYTFQLSGPDTALLAAQGDARVAAQRIVLVGGEISALLLGFAFVAAVGLRRGVANERRRLAGRGARRGQLALAVTAEVGGMTLAAGALGLLAGAAAVLLVGRAAGVPSAAVLRHALLTPLALGLLAGLWLLATLAIVAVAAAPESRRSRRAIRLSDVVALGAAAAVVIGVASTSTNPAQLSTSEGSRLLFTVLPVMVCLAAGLAVGRLLGPLMRGVERLARGLPIAVRLAALALARAPTRTAATVGFVTVAVGLGLFAASYRATLQAGAHDEAAFAVPLDYTVSEGTALVLPLQVGPLSRYDRLAPGVRAYPVLRRGATIPGSGTSVLSPTVLGVPPAAVASLRWRGDFSSLPQATLARRLAAQGPATLRGVALPPGTRELRLRVRIRGAPVALALVGEDRGGGLATIALGERPAGTWQLTARLRPPRALRAVVALEVTEQALNAFGAAHRAAEGPVAIIPSGSAALGPLTAATGGRADVAVTDWSGWIPRGGATVTAGAQPRLHYAFSGGQTVLLRVRQVTDGRRLPVVVSPNIAAAAPAGGAITLNFQDAQLPARIVGVASRFPASDDLGQGFVVADESRLATALSADAPGTATPDELWLSTPASEATRVGDALSRPPFTALQVASRRALQAQLASDPLARGITLTLIATSVVALALAAIGLWVTLASDARDERGDLFDLEAQGVRPETLRRQLRLRSFLLLAVGVVGGAALGVLLSRLVVAIVGVSAETTVPDPPLAYQSGWTVALAGLAVLAAVTVVLTELTVRRALAGRSPTRASWSLA